MTIYCNNSTTECQKATEDLAQRMESSLEENPELRLRVTDCGVDYCDEDGASICSAKSFKTQPSHILLNQPPRNMHIPPIFDDTGASSSSVHGTLVPGPKPNLSTTTASELQRSLSTLRYEYTLCRSRVYKRCVLNFETSSFKSLRTASLNWSQLSEITLSAVSCVSIILLPMYGPTSKTPHFPISSIQKHGPLYLNRVTVQNQLLPTVPIL